MNGCGVCLLCADTCPLDMSLCLACRDCLPRLLHYCPQCSIGMNTALPQGSLCGACLRKPPSFDRCVALGAYDFPLTELIARFKFQGVLSGGKALARLLLAELNLHWDKRVPDVLIPVPLHPSRLRARGFNQSIEVARELSRPLGIPLDVSLCRRQRRTPPQKGLNAHERSINLRGAFMLGALPDHWKHVALVDDVVTTMTTVNEIAKLLKKAGIDRVDVVCLARVGTDGIRTDT